MAGSWLQLTAVKRLTQAGGLNVLFGRPWRLVTLVCAFVLFSGYERLLERCSGQPQALTWTGMVSACAAPASWDSVAQS
ncbi:hypothetical protein BDY19DRAFT_945851 [Irpex rosettiformis]|uniref:Uncharacterized protein n=1 Tax=Irpex rosettiformis TaxID=378272 RepID=A0ACB8U311_9APHY|nr:hypothetical protein BDY19DRAFT_945851 [Irpex rosettiformis]